MKTRKIITLIITFMLIFNISAIYAFADGGSTISQTEAVKIARDAIKEYMNVEIKVSQDASSQDGYIENIYPHKLFNGKDAWDINYSNISEEFQVWILVDSGSIVYFNRSNIDQFVDFNDNKISKEEAGKIAYSYIKKLAGKEITEIKDVTKEYEEAEPFDYIDNLDTYRFSYARIKNGIVCYENGINIDIRTDKTLSNFQVEWNDQLVFPAKENIIDSKKASELFYENIESKPYYIVINYVKANNDVKLIYKPYSNCLEGVTLDAKSGTIAYHNGYIVDKKIDLTPDEKENFFSKAQDRKIRSTVDEKMAMKIAESLVENLLGKGFKYSFGTSNGSSIIDGKYYIYVFGENGPNIHITVNAVTGDIDSADIYNYCIKDKSKEEITTEATLKDAYKKAVDTIAKVYPDKILKINTVPEITQHSDYRENERVQDPNYTFTFNRMENGIECIGDKIQVVVSTDGTKIYNLNFSWTEKLKFPSPEGMMSSSEAKKIFIDNLKLELRYMNDYLITYGLKDSNNLRLVYYPSWDISMYERPYLNAYTGEYINSIFTFNVDSEEKMKILDKIGKDPNSDELYSLYYMGVIDNENFDANKKLTKIELIKMLVNLKGYKPYSVLEDNNLKFKNLKKGDKNYKYLQLAVKYGIISNANVDLKLSSYVTREELAEYAIKLTKYSAIAKDSQAFILKCKDLKNITVSRRGYIAVANILKIMSVSQKEFKPKEYVTEGEGALVVYGIMNSVE